MGESASPPLLPYEENFASQFGEDGVIERALETIGRRDEWCVEFGAWDGRHLSNTYALIERRGYSAVLIEADPRKFADLQKTHADRPGVIALNRYVGFDGPGCLDHILSATPTPRDFDLLSIDIDGNDYHVWESVKDFKPKVVVIEYNPSIPNDVDWVQPRDMRVTQGSSLTALLRLARTKGYRLVHATRTNGVFVDEQYFSLFGIRDDSPSALRPDTSLVSQMFQTYDGMIHVVGNSRLIWHKVTLDKAKIQPIPRLFRTFPSNFSKIQRACWPVYVRWRKLMRILSHMRSSGGDRDI